VIFSRVVLVKFFIVGADTSLVAIGIAVRESSSSQWEFQFIPALHLLVAHWSYFPCIARSLSRWTCHCYAFGFPFCASFAAFCAAVCGFGTPFLSVVEVSVQDHMGVVLLMCLIPGWLHAAFQ
jgi:hypothetical protein